MGDYDEMIGKYSCETPVTATKRAICVRRAGKIEKERVKEAGKQVL